MGSPTHNESIMNVASAAATPMTRPKATPENRDDTLMLQLAPPRTAAQHTPQTAPSTSTGSHSTVKVPMRWAHGVRFNGPLDEEDKHFIRQLEKIEASKANRVAFARARSTMDRGAALGTLNAEQAAGWKSAAARQRQFQEETTRRARREKERLTKVFATYNYKWMQLESLAPCKPFSFEFVNFPWPVLEPVVTREDITEERVREFILHPLWMPGQSNAAKLELALEKWTKKIPRIAFEPEETYSIIESQDDVVHILSHMTL
ncbi:predicted protein [Postia placenta Mad-698-R]|uniref:Uncharacterized protein n=1 Tax=Rhodonia placenta TaxID=104341 RepID=A0A8H7P8T2_9APHY|nr:predicted protein [Postia placenta Mad-698-R]KAF9819701.1 hypothetical protein IEO21_01966 [Postia placenta]